jgi:hypothetical protein
MPFFTVGLFCITVGICIPRGTSLSLSLLRLTSLVLFYLSVDQFAYFRDLVLDAVFFFGAGLPGFVVLF